MAQIIAPPRSVEIVFSPAPAHNVIASLSLLDMAEQFTGLGQWVYETKDALTPEQLRANQLVLQDINPHLGDKDWPSVPAWLDDLAAQDAREMRDRALAWWMAETSKTIGAELPAPEKLLADKELYLSLADQAATQAGDAFDLTFWQEMHNLLTDPAARQRFIVGHLQAMWEQFIAFEWERNLPLLQESIAAFESLGLSGLTAHEALRRVVLRAQIPPEGQSWLSALERLIFIPSVHSGPYLIRLAGLDPAAAWFVYGARIPEGASRREPALNRSELLMRLNALANDTRLRILELLAERGELGTPEVVAQLELSQSAAARHLEHLTATGYLTTRRQRGTNTFRLNPDQVDDTFRVLKALFTERLV